MEKENYDIDKYDWRPCKEKMEKYRKQEKIEEELLWGGPPTKRQLSTARKTSRLSMTKIPEEALKNKKTLFEWTKNQINFYHTGIYTWEELERQINQWDRVVKWEERCNFLDSLGSDEKVLDFLNSLEGEEKIDYIESLSIDDPLRDEVEIDEIELRIWKRRRPGQK